MTHELPPLDRIRLQYGNWWAKKWGSKERTAETTSKRNQCYNV